MSSTEGTEDAVPGTAGHPVPLLYRPPPKQPRIPPSPDAGKSVTMTATCGCDGAYADPGNHNGRATYGLLDTTKSGKDG
jgi:hypothetical protein